MSNRRLKAHRSLKTTAARPVILTGFVAALTCVLIVPSYSQISGDLRGPVREDAANRDIFGRSSQTSLAANNEPEPEYVPLLEGAESENGTQDPNEPIIVEAPRDLGSEPARTPLTRGALEDEETSVSQGRTFDDLDADDQPLSQAEQARRDRANDPGDDVASIIRRTGPIDDNDPVNEPARVTNERTGAIEGIDSDREENPYAPLGMRMGTFDLTASLETGLRVTDNVDSSPGGTDGVLSETTLRFSAVSDWSRHSATLDASFTHSEALSGTSFSEPNGTLDGTLTLEVGNDYQVNLTAGYDINRESAIGPANTVSRSLRHLIDGSLGLEKSAGKYRFAITGAAQREQFTGGTVPQTERDATLLTATLRSGYELSPALVPFVEGEIGRRIYDQKIDSNGFARSSDRVAFRGGAEFDFGEKLTGELSTGWIRETLDDPALADVTGLTVNANVNWSPSRQTNLALNASTFVEGTTTAGSSGSILYTADATLTRQVRANLEASLSAGGYYRDFANTGGYDQSLTGGAAFTWWLNRTFGLTGRVEHENVMSSDPAREYSRNSAFLGIILQR